MKSKVALAVAGLAMGAGMVAGAAPAVAATSAHSGNAAQRSCTYDVCMYSKKNLKGTWEGYNHYKNHCVSYDHAFTMRSLKINSSQGTTFWSKKGCKGQPSMSFKGHIKTNYTFTARSSR